MCFKIHQFVAAKACCRRVFSRYGLPEGIVVDNGNPFAGEGLLGLSRLSSWWMSLGIKVHFIEAQQALPERPFGAAAWHAQNRSHPTPFNQSQAQQRRFDRWREYYNEQRPHEAIAQRYPSELYRPGPKPASWIRPLHYPSPTIGRYVKAEGIQF